MRQIKRVKPKYNHKTDSIRRPAFAALCAALALLICALLGGEDTARSLVASLAQSSSFLMRAVVVELGVSPTSYDVHTPRGTAAAKYEDAEAPVSESTFLPGAPVSEDTPTLSAADKADTVTVNNETSYSIDVPSMLNQPLSLAMRATDEPQVLIVHTHGSEAYTPDAAYPYTPTETERTTDTRFNVVRVGDELAQVLKAHGIETVHRRELFDTPEYTGCYDRSLVAINEELEKHPSIEVVIDVHRDSILTDEGRAYKTVCDINDKQLAQLMLVVGTNDGGLSHDHWRDNLNVTVNLQAILNKRYPGLMRPVNLRTQRFNQHARTGSMLIEVGSSGNTLGEALDAVRLFGETLSDYLNSMK